MRAHVPILSTMRHRLYVLFLLACLALGSRAALPDSLSLHLVGLAMQGDARSLRPLYATYRDSLSTLCRLACDLALAQDDRDDRRTVECIDSLTRFFTPNIPKANRAAWDMQKAAALCRLGRYAEAARFCRQRLATLDRAELQSPVADALRRYEAKGLRYADTASVRTRLLAAVDRHDHAELVRLLADADTASLDRYALLRLRAARAEVTNRPYELHGAANALFAEYPDSLETEEARGLFDLTAAELAYAGEWEALGAFCEGYARACDCGDGYARLARYRLLAQAWAGQPATSVERPGGTPFVMTSYDWPLTTTLGLNGHRLADVIVDTGMPFTLLSAADAAACGVQTLADTVEVATLFGPVTASTGLADEINLGGIRIRHVCVLVRHDGDGEPAGRPLANILGLNELRRLGRVEFAKDRLLFPTPSRTGGQGTEFFLLDQEIRFAAAHDGRDHLFGLDTGAAAQILSEAAFPAAATDTADFVLDMGGSRVRLPYVVLTPGRAAGYDGLLGIGLVRSCTRFVLDFSAMRLSAVRPTATPFRHPTLADWFNRRDGFGLERNAASLSLLQSDDERELTRLLVLLGKNRPDTLVGLLDAQLAHPGYDASVRLYFLRRKEQALEDLGRYAEASAVVDEIARQGRTGERMTREIQAKKLTLQALAGEQPPTFALAAPTTVAGEADGTYAVEVNGRAATASVDLDHFTTTMSVREARRRGVRIVLKRKHLRTGSRMKVGIIDSLRVGEAVVRNLVVNLVKGKSGSIRLGMDFLRHAGEVRFADGTLTLAPHGSLRTADATCPIRMAEGLPALPPAADLPAAYQPRELRTALDTPRPAAFVRRTGSLTLDFEHMRMK